MQRECKSVAVRTVPTEGKDSVLTGHSLTATGVQLRHQPCVLAPAPSGQGAAGAHFEIEAVGS